MRSSAMRVALRMQREVETSAREGRETPSPKIFSAVSVDLHTKYFPTCVRTIGAHVHHLQILRKLRQQEENLQHTLLDNMCPLP